MQRYKKEPNAQIIYRRNNRPFDKNTNLCKEIIGCTRRTNKPPSTSCKLLSGFWVGVPGLEPGKAGPESAVLPLHHTPIFYIM